MEKLTTILAMGGFAAFVWPSYLIAALIMIILTISSLRSLKRNQKILTSLKERGNDET